MAQRPNYRFNLTGPGATPQTLDETVNDLKRIGKGLLVGETADLLGLPADLLGLYYDLRYGETPEGIQSLIDTIGSEALAKRFMGEEFPEFGMNLESFGRAVAPGALLAKGIAAARLAARGRNMFPPSNNNAGYALATVGDGAKVDVVEEVPETVGERLFMTQSGEGGQAKKIRQDDEKFFEEGFDVDVEAGLNLDRTIFSNLLNELEKIGKTSSRLSILEPRMIPKRVNGQIVKDATGKVVKEPGPTLVRGIDFKQKPTGRELLGYFTNDLKPEFSKKFGGMGLKDSGGSGLQSRLGKEAVETGLIRYLENNPDKVITKEELINAASLFKPNIKMSVYSKNEEASLEGQIKSLGNTGLNLSENDPRRAQIVDSIKILRKKLDDYSAHNPWTHDGIQMLKVQDLGSVQNPQTAGTLNSNNQSLVRTDNVTFLFSGDKGFETFMGKSVDKASTNEIDRKINEIDDYFKAMGETTSLRKLGLGNNHGYAIPNYYGHVRGTAMITIDPATGKEYKTLSINEIQSNQAGKKEKRVNAEDAKLMAEFKRLEANITNLNDVETSKYNRLKKKIEESNAVGTPKVLTNRTRMDALKIVEEDRKLGTGFIKFAEEKAILQKDYDKKTIKMETLEKEFGKLNDGVGGLKRALFKTDESLNRDRILLSDFRKAKAKIIEDLEVASEIPSPALPDGTLAGIDREKNMPNILASLFFRNHDNYGDHLADGRGFDSFDIAVILDEGGQTRPRSPINLANPENPESLKVLKQVAKTRYGTEGNTDILQDVFALKDNDLNYDFDLSTFPHVKGPNPPRVVYMSDIGMMREHYEDIGELFDNDLIDEGTYKLYAQKRPTYKDYIDIKRKVDPDYFLDKDNVNATITHLVNDRERKIEAGYANSLIFNKVMNDPEITKLLESNNIEELRDRYEALNKQQKLNAEQGIPQDSASYYAEVNKIKDDLRNDFGVQTTDFEGTGKDFPLVHKGAIGKAFKKAASEVYDEFRKTEKKIPMIGGGTYTQLVREGFKRPSVLTNLLGRKSKGAFSKDNFDKVLGKESYKDAHISQSYIDFIEKNFQTDLTFLESAIAKKGLTQFNKDKKYLENQILEAQALQQDSFVQLEEFNKKRDLDKILDNLRDKLPENLKKSLDEIIKHQKFGDNNNLEKFLAGPPVLEYGQMTELMVHNVIKKAKDMGFERVHFPSMDAYDDMSQRQYLGSGVKRIQYGDAENKTAYDFSIGRPLTKALKKYGKGYTTQVEVIAKKKPVTTALGTPLLGQRQQQGIARIGKKQTRANAFDEDLHRIVDLTVDEASKKADLKIPRMAKGGILSKFRKVS